MSWHHEKGSRARYVGPESRGRISGFCFDSSHCSLGARFGSPDRTTRVRGPSGETRNHQSPLFFRRIERSEPKKKGKRQRTQGPLYCNGHYRYSPKWLVPCSYCAIYGRSLVVHIVFRGSRSTTLGRVAPFARNSPKSLFLPFFKLNFQLSSLACRGFFLFFVTRIENFI